MVSVVWCSGKVRNILVIDFNTKKQIDKKVIGDLTFFIYLKHNFRKNYLNTHLILS